MAKAAGAKIDSLEAELRSIRATVVWHLTNDQRKQLAQAIASHEPQTFQIECILGNDTALMFADDLAAAFNSVNGWHVSVDTDMTVHGTLEGIWIGLHRAQDAKITNGTPDTLAETPDARALADILQAGHIPFKFGFDETLPKDTHYRLVITRKPNVAKGNGS